MALTRLATPTSGQTIDPTTNYTTEFDTIYIGFREDGYQELGTVDDLEIIAGDSDTTLAPGSYGLNIAAHLFADDAYVFSGARPQAESGTSLSGKGTNGAGIDLGEQVWHLLGMTDNSLVSWEFLTP